MPSPSDADRQRRTPGAAEAAASWFARLRSDAVSVEDLVAFQSWRNDPAHDAAYRQVETVWARGETLRGDPDIARAMSAALDRPRRAAASRAVRVGYLLAACLLVALAFGFWAVSGGYVGARTYETAVGQQQTLRLADGSVVRLDTDSRVHVRLGSARREVDLFRGRAFFTVAHDASRPFLVTAGNAEVRAVGTRFSVQTEASDVRVVLVQGVVAVSSTHGAGRPEPVRLAAGQELTVDGGLGAPRAVDVALATSWLQNQLVFRDLPLKDAIAEVNRYTPRKLVLDAPGAGDTPVNGVFDTGDPMAFATAAADVCGLVVVARHDGAVHLRAPDRAV